MKTVPMKTERVTLLVTPDFKAFLTAEAAKEHISVGELVRGRCEQRPDENELLLASLTEELRTSVREAQISLKSGLTEANAVLDELRANRTKTALAKSAVKTRKAAGGVHA